jgi:transposase
VKEYSKKFRMRMVSRLIGPNALSAMELSKEVGVSQTTLSRWLRESPTIGAMSKKKIAKKVYKNEMVNEQAKSWTTEEKLRVVVAATGVTGIELGAFLRREGLHEAQLEEWRTVVRGAFNSSASKNTNTSERKRIRELERELNRKEKALAEAAALLVLSKKYRALVGDEGDDTTNKNGKK